MFLVCRDPGNVSKFCRSLYITKNLRILFFVCISFHFLFSRLGSIATHTARFVRRPSVCPSVCHTFLSHFPKLCFAGDTCIPRNAASIFKLINGGCTHSLDPLWKENDMSFSTCLLMTLKWSLLYAQYTCAVVHFRSFSGHQPKLKDRARR